MNCQPTRRSVLRIGEALAGLSLVRPMRASAGLETRRLVVVYAPNGVHMPAWTPDQPGRLELTPTLAPFQEFVHRCTVVSGLGFAPEVAAAGLDGPHSLACAGYLSGVAPLRSEQEPRAAVSIDQSMARMCKDTWLPSLQFSGEDPIPGTDREPGYGTAMLNHLSWSTPHLPLPAETDLRAAFLRLFQGDAGMWIRNSYARSLLADPESANQLRLAQYLQSLHAARRRLEKIDTLPRRERMELTMEMIALALHSGVSRVAVMMLGREKSRTTFPELGIPETHHQLSQRARDEGTIAKLTAIDRYYASVTAYLLRSLAGFRDGNGSLLDSTMVLYGSGMSDGRAHRHSGLPVLLAGGPPGRASAGQHRRLSTEIDLQELHSALMSWFQGDTSDIEI